jgi:hypothetical protein
VPRDDEAAITQALRDLISGGLKDAYRPCNLEVHRYPGPAHLMLGVVQEAIERRDRSSSAATESAPLAR